MKLISKDTPQSAPGKPGRTVPGAIIEIDKDATDQGFSARFICFTGYTLKDGRHPIMLQLIHHRKIKRYSIKGLTAHLSEWDPTSASVVTGTKGKAATDGILAGKMAEVKKHVRAMLRDEKLSLAAFDERWSAKKDRSTDTVKGWLYKIAEELEADGKHGYADTFTSTGRVFDRYMKGKEVKLRDLTPKILEGFAKDLKAQGCKPGSISVYMRTLRTGINRAIKAKVITIASYPFDTNQNEGFSMKGLKSGKRPRPLSPEDMERIKAFPMDAHPTLADSVRLFMFSYWSCGMNFIDMAKLRHSDIHSGVITYIRTKIAHHGEEEATIQPPVTEHMQAIMDHYSSDSPYVFPILNEAHATPKQVWNRSKKYLKQVNADLKKLATLLDIQVNLTFYVARHTYATRMFHAEVPVPRISRSLGHTSIKTTEHYLKHLDHKLLKDAMNEHL